MYKPKNKEGKFESFHDFSNIENDKYVIKWLEGIKSKKSRTIPSPISLG